MKRVLLSLLTMIACAAPADALLCTPILGCDCTVTASDLDFDAFTPFAGAQNAEGEIQVNCTGVVDVAPSISVRINKGVWGTIPARKMHAASGDLLSYNIYTTSARNVIWGDGTGGSAIVNVSGGLLTLGSWSVSRIVYGRVTPTNVTQPGDYSDQVVVRIDW
ncbi:MAG: spore coat protein U domain-containing protein [Caulobacterales bacterium]